MLLPSINSSRGVFVAVRVDRGGCYTFLARGLFLWLLHDSQQVVLSTDLSMYNTSTTIIVIEIIINNLDNYVLLCVYLLKSFVYRE